MIPVSAANSFALSPLSFHRATRFAQVSRTASSIATSANESYAIDEARSGTRFDERILTTTTTTKPNASTPVTRLEKPATDPAKRTADAELITRYRYACRQVEDLLGVTPDEVRRRCAAALTRAATEAGRRDVDYDTARVIVAGIVRDEMQGEP